MDTTDIEVTIRRFLTRQFLFEFAGEVDAASNLFGLGLIDSFGFVELVSFLEREFAMKVSDEDLVDGSLTSLVGIVGLVGRRCGR